MSNKMKTPEECEEILDEAAKLIMVSWDLNAFKITHKHLFDTVIAAMQVASTPEYKSVCFNEELGEERCPVQCYQCSVFEKSV